MLSDLSMGGIHVIEQGRSEKRGKLNGQKYGNQ